MKKIAILLAVAMLLSCAGAAIGEATGGMTEITMPDRVADPIGVQRGTRIVVGATTELSGYFATELWGKNTADMDARTLLHGYSTVVMSREFGMALDGTVVKGVQVKNQADGGRVYTLSLADDLCFSDGTKITAKDYVFSLLMSGSPVIAELGGTPQDLGYITGYAAYQAGEAQELAGLRLLSDNSFSIHVAAEYQSYFYGLMLLNVTPYPTHVIAPDCDVADDGHGAYVDGAFDAELLSGTLLDPESGYVFNPRVTSGPYVLESYDAETRVALFAVNERYMGNYEGQKPHIERIVFKPVRNETMVAELANGEVDLLNKVTDAVAIGEGFTLAGQGDRVRSTDYLRTGFAFLSFACEEGVTSSVSVRKAIASCIDSKVFVASTLSDVSALPVHGYYGLGQWMPTESFPEEPDKGKDQLVVADELAKLEVSYDLEAAKRLLMQDGWSLNASGEPFAEGTDDVRYRDGEGELRPLVIRWAKTADNPVADSIERALAGPFAAIGMKLDVTEMPFSEMLQHYYRQTQREYDMFYLASNFGYVFDPYGDFNTADKYQGSMNTTGLRDEALMQLAWDMRTTNPTEVREYTEKWLAFQQRWVELMPMVPLYSNVYFDFYSSKLQDYNIPQYLGWAHAIPYAWIGEAAFGDGIADAANGELGATALSF